MDKIVFINQWSSHLSKDIVNAFAGEFAEVALITGNLSKSGRSLDKKVKISRIIKYNKDTVAKRIFTWFLGTIQIIFLVNFKYRGYHLLLTSNPPFSNFVPIFCSNEYSVQILDIYPDALEAAGFIKNDSWLNSLWKKRNKKFFASAKHIYTITNGMADTISQYVSREKIKVIVQWPSNDKFIPIDRDHNMFIKENALEDYFIVMYSGNLGLGHHVGTLVEVAKYVQDQEDLKFIIIGEGWSKPAIERKIMEYDLKNCLLLPFQSAEMFKHSSQAANIGVVSVSKELAPLCVPIKTYNAIHNIIPLLCITEGESELETLTKRYDIGKCFAPNKIKEISEYILSLKTNKNISKIYKENLQKCSGNFTFQNALMYVEEFKSLD